jgi:glycosyltransferase involved in cell wall biosynthesis
MKKKIVFMVINMNIGGTEKALLNMIAEIPKDQYSITILMLENKGGFLNSIPSGVNVEVLEGYSNVKKLLNNPPVVSILARLKDRKPFKAFSLLSRYVLSKALGDKRIFLNYILKNFSNMEQEYDIAVAYAGPMDFISFFVAKKIKAKKKIQWIHFDVTKIGFDEKFVSKIYKQFNKIFVVSNEGENKLINLLPSLKDKIEAFSNIMSPELVIKMANEGVGFEDTFDGLRILTVGRLSKEKGQDLIIPVLAKLKENGFNVRWYCIGEGNARKEYEEVIKKYNVENDFILLGSSPNPYSFMKYCDIYVQPSRHEGYCITLAEARALNKPIVTTDFVGAREQINHNHDGLIVNFNDVEILNAIKNLIVNSELRYKFIRNLRSQSMNTSSEINKLY